MLQRWKSVVQINEQCCIWKNNEKIRKQNRCKTCKRQKRLFKMDIQTMLYVTTRIFDNDLVAIRKFAVGIIKMKQLVLRLKNSLD